MVPHAHTPLGLLVREDRGGNEVWQLGMFSDGRVRPLTTDLKAIHQSVTVHPDRRRAGLGWNPNGQADMVLGEIDLETGELTPWAEPGGFWQWEAWSPDGTRAAVMKTMGTPTEAYLLDRDGGLVRLLEGALRASTVEWIDAGPLVLTDVGRDYLGLALVDPEHPDAVARWLFEEDHDVEGVVVDPGKTRAALIVNDGIYDSIRVIELAAGREVDRLALPSGVTIADHSGDAGYHIYWTGDGMRFQSLDDKTFRWNSVKDGCEAARHLKGSEQATTTAAMGGSYGGFMTLAVLVEDPDLWDAGVETVGIADWHTFFRNMPPWRGVLRINEYGDPNGAEADFLRQISPLHRASSIKAPLLVIHGRNDPRVPVGESIQIGEAVGRAEVLIFEDEGHGVAKLANQVTANGKILEFLAAHLL